MTGNWTDVVSVRTHVSASAVEAVRGPGASAEGPAGPDRRPHVQEDRQAGGHLLGRDEAVWSHVSVCTNIRNLRLSVCVGVIQVTCFTPQTAAEAETEFFIVL